jgi:hypothetical protein
MKRLILLLSALALILALVPAAMVQAKKPAPKLDCTITYEWMPGWVGKIYGDIGGEDGFYAVWPGGGDMRFAGQTSHYSGERAFEIWDKDPAEEGAVLLMVGDTSTGSTTVRHGKNSNWRTSGIVTEAHGEFADWVGRRVYQAGHFTWQNIGTPEEPIIVPKDGSGTFRVN